MRRKTMRDTLLDILRQPTLDEPTGEYVTGSEALRRALKRKADSGDAEAKELYESGALLLAEHDNRLDVKPPEAI